MAKSTIDWLATIQKKKEGKKKQELFDLSRPAKRNRALDFAVRDTFRLSTRSHKYACAVLPGDTLPVIQVYLLLDHDYL